MKMIPGLIVAVLLISNTVAISPITHHHYNSMTHDELCKYHQSFTYSLRAYDVFSQHYIVRRQAITADDCTIDDCVVDDECITEESYNTGTLDSCFSKLIIL